MIRRALFLAALAIVVITNAPLWFPPRVVQVGDEGYIAAFAWRMAEGRMLPYVDAVSHRGPLVYFPPAIVTWILGPSAVPVRICALAFALGTALLLFYERKWLAPFLYAVMLVVVPAWIPY